MQLTVQALRGVVGDRTAPSTWLQDDPGGALELPPLPAPPGLEAHWRRASALSRWVLALAAPLVAWVPPERRPHLPVVWATGLGELGTTEGVLQLGLSRGKVRPAAFRGSVHNTPASRMSVAFRLRGRVETLGVGAGAATVALLRAAVLLRQAPQVLVVAGDVPSPGAQAWLAARGLPPAVPQVVALLLGAEGPGARLTLGSAATADVGVPPPLAPAGEARGVPPSVAVLPVAGLTVVAALAAGGGGVVREAAPGALPIAVQPEGAAREGAKR